MPLSNHPDFLKSLHLFVFKVIRIPLFVQLFINLIFPFLQNVYIFKVYSQVILICIVVIFQLHYQSFSLFAILVN